MHYMLTKSQLFDQNSEENTPHTQALFIVHGKQHALYTPNHMKYNLLDHRNTFYIYMNKYTCNRIKSFGNVCSPLVPGFVVVFFVFSFSPHHFVSVPLSFSFAFTLILQTRFSFLLHRPKSLLYGAFVYRVFFFLHFFFIFIWVFIFSLFSKVCAILFSASVVAVLLLNSLRRRAP